MSSEASAPPPVATAPTTQQGCEQWAQLVDQYEWDAAIMLAIMQAENRACDPAQHNLTASETHRDMHGNTVCVGSYGLLQVGCLHFTRENNPADPATNIAVGYAVWKQQGYAAWTQYRNGEYLKYL